ncbi:MAG: iron ABC transporter permease [Flavobacteriales bacterium]|nr:iron ABC transporter permease [Flavobacteriales bacterium]
MKGRSRTGRLWPWLGLVAFGVLGLWCSVRWGTVEMDADSFRAGLWSNGGAESKIVWGLRIPRSVMGFGAGAALGVAGLLMQTLFRNPLAGPSVLGITSGASLGVAWATLGAGALGAGAGLWGAEVCGAALGSFAVLGLLMALMAKFNSRSGLLVFGLMLGYLAGALVTVMQAQATAGALRAFVFWGMGSFADAGLGAALVTISLAAVAIATTWRFRRSLDVWTLGSSQAQSMGVDPRKTSRMLVIGSGVLAAWTTAWCGPVAFLGLATPHGVRALMRSSRHGDIALACGLGGGALAVWADWLAHLAGLPLNAVLSIVGAPVVIAVILSKISRNV